MANFVRCPAHSCSNRKRQHDSWFPGLAVTVKNLQFFLDKWLWLGIEGYFFLKSLATCKVYKQPIHLHPFMIQVYIIIYDIWYIYTHFKNLQIVTLVSQQMFVDSQPQQLLLHAQGTWATLSEFASVSFNPSLGFSTKTSRNCRVPNI